MWRLRVRVPNSSVARFIPNSTVVENGKERDDICLSEIANDGKLTSNLFHMGCASRQDNRDNFVLA